MTRAAAVAKVAPRGVALVLVLWVTAALSVLVAGLVAAQRGELRLAGVERSRLQATAVGRAAVQLTAQALAVASPVPARLTRQRPEGVDAAVAEVETLPLTGLIDLNAAAPPLLAALFAHAGGVDAETAAALAAAVQRRRLGTEEAGAAAAPPRRFDAVEELTALPGVDHDLLARIAPLLTTASGGTGRVNPVAAPLPVLRVLAGGDAAIAQRLADERDIGGVAIDTTRLEASFLDATVSSRYRITARVGTPDGLRWAVAVDLDLRPGLPGGAPWQTLRTVVQRDHPVNDGGG